MGYEWAKYDWAIGYGFTVRHERTGNGYDTKFPDKQYYTCGTCEKDIMAIDIEEDGLCPSCKKLKIENK
jgi:rubrerythrin